MIPIEQIMPIYEFTCQDCHQHFEVLRPISRVDETPPSCEFCGNPSTVRKLSNIIAVFGSGPQRQVRSGGGSCKSCSSGGSIACRSCGGGR